MNFSGEKKDDDYKAKSPGWEPDFSDDDLIPSIEEPSSSQMYPGP